MRAHSGVGRNSGEADGSSAFNPVCECVCVCVCVSVSLQQHFSQASSGSNNLPHSRPVRIFFFASIIFFYPTRAGGWVNLYFFI